MSQDVVNVEDAGRASPGTDAIFSILSDERRRYALYCLQEHRQPMALADLADEVARLEYDERSLATIPAEDVKRVYMSLYHNHVPKMADANVLEYDQDSDAIRLTHEITVVDLEDVI